MADPVASGIQRIPGSSINSFVIAFLLIFCLGTVLVFAGLDWAGGWPLVASFAVVIVGGCAGLAAVLARLASFQVTSLVTLSGQGIEGVWHGPFGGTAVQHLSWSEIRNMRMVRFGGGIVTVTADNPLSSLFVTLPQAAAIVGHPLFPRKALPPRVKERIDQRS